MVLGWDVSQKVVCVQNLPPRSTTETTKLLEWDQCQEGFGVIWSTTFVCWGWERSRALFSRSHRDREARAGMSTQLDED